MPKEKPLKLEHIPMHCPVCKERFMNLFGQPLPNHAQLRCLTTNGDEMDIGICENCIEQGITDATVKAVLEGIKDYWYIEIDIDKNLKASERKERKDAHAKHQIASVEQMIRTGKEAEQKARKRGDLQ